MSDALLGIAALLRGLEPLANGVVDLDPVARARINALAGKRLRLCPVAPQTAAAGTAAAGAVTFAFGAGRFTLHAGDTLPVDLELTGSPRALWHALRTGRAGLNADGNAGANADRNAEALADGPAGDPTFDIRAEGDLSRLTTLAAILRDLSPDLLAPLRAIVGPAAGSALHTGAVLTREVARRVAASVGPLLGGSIVLLRDIAAILRRRGPGG